MSQCALFFLLPAPMSTPDDTCTRLPLAQIPDAGAAECEAMVDGALESVVLVRHGSQVRGWLNICPHAGRRLDWAPGQFLLSREGHLVCAAHGAAFETQRGECISGPCRGQLLQDVPVRVEDDAVCVGG